MTDQPNALEALPAAILAHHPLGPWFQRNQPQKWAGHCQCGVAIWADTCADFHRLWAEHVATAIASAAVVKQDLTGAGGDKIDIGVLAASIRVNLYRAVPDMTAYPVGIVEAVLRRALASGQIETGV